MIELKLSDLTPDQLRAIAEILDGNIRIGSAQVEQVAEPPKPVDLPQQEIITDNAKIAEAFEADQQAEDDVGAQFAASPVQDDTDERLAKCSTGELIPWDDRIHSGSKAINADGSWKLKKGVDRAVELPKVEAELLGVTATEPETTVSDDTPPPPPPAPVNTAQPSVFDTPTGPTFPDVLHKLSVGKASGLYTSAQVDEACAALEIPNFGALAVKNELLEKFMLIMGME